MPWANPNGYWLNARSINSHAPAQSGVYGLYKAELWIYIGESEDIRARLLQHLNGDNSCINREAPTQFTYELVPAGQRVARKDLLIFLIFLPLYRTLDIDTFLSRR